MAELQCPYCFEHFDPWAVQFRCINNERCRERDDDELSVYRGTPQTALPFFALEEPRIMGFRLPGEVPRQVNCPHCNSITHKRICPYCHNELPSGFGTLKEYPIALMGARASGKSHYIGVLIQELRRQVAGKFDMMIEHADDYTRERYDREYKQPLYTQGHVIDKTQSARTEPESRYPLIFRLTKIDGDRKAVGLNFFDHSGEIFESTDDINRFGRYIGYAEGLVLLLDPLQFPYVRDNIPSSIPLPEASPEQDTFLVRATNLIRDARRIPGDVKIPTPIAVVLTKIDALRKLLGTDADEVFQPINHRKAVNLQRINNTHEILKSYLPEWWEEGGENLINKLNKDYKRWRFFGISALGSAPDQNNRILKGVSPIRIEDPLLWLLHRNDLIPRQGTSRTRLRR